MTPQRQVTLDTVMQEAEGKRVNQEPNKAETPKPKFFPLTRCNSPKMMHNKPCAQ